MTTDNRTATTDNRTAAHGDTDLIKIFGAVLIGAVLIYSAGFSQIVHAAAHDQRHATAFPCH